MLQRVFIKDTLLLFLVSTAGMPIQAELLHRYATLH